MTDTRRVLLRFRTSDENHRVTTFELFFDLVFVFALTQVSEFMANAHSANGVLQGLIILGILWWAWVSYGWLGNQTFVDEGLIRIGMAVAMVATFIVALVIPEAFDDLPGACLRPSSSRSRTLWCASCTSCCTTSPLGTTGRCVDRC